MARIDAETGRWLNNRAWFGVIAAVCILMVPGVGLVNDVAANKKHTEAVPGMIAAHTKTHTQQEIFNALVKKDIENVHRELKILNGHLERMRLISKKGAKDAEKKRKKTS